MTMQLHEIQTVTKTNEVGTFIVHVDLTDMNGQRYLTDYVSRESDVYGLNPLIRKWLEDNERQYELLPIPETIPEPLGSLPAGIFRMRMIQRLGIMPSAVLVKIATDPNHELLSTYWEYFTSYDRDSEHLVKIMIDLMEVTPEQLDSLWEI